MKLVLFVDLVIAASLLCFGRETELYGVFSEGYIAPVSLLNGAIGSKIPLSGVRFITSTNTSLFASTGTEIYEIPLDSSTTAPIKRVSTGPNNLITELSLDEESIFVVINSSNILSFSRSNYTKYEYYYQPKAPIVNGIAFVFDDFWYVTGPSLQSSVWVVTQAGEGEVMLPAWCQEPDHIDKWKSTIAVSCKNQVFCGVDDWLAYEKYDIKWNLTVTNPIQAVATKGEFIVTPKGIFDERLIVVANSDGLFWGNKKTEEGNLVQFSTAVPLDITFTK